MNLLGRLWWAATHPADLPDEADRLIWQARCHVRWWWQRRTRGWDDRDCWSLDLWLARCLVERLPVLQRMKHGIGADFFDGLPCGPDGNPTDEALEIAGARQERAFEQMIAGFRLAGDEDVCDHPTDQQRACIEEAYRLLARYHYALQD